MRLPSILIVGVAVLASVLATPLQRATELDSSSSWAYKNPDLPIDERVTDLISRMTLDEKVSQLIQGDIRDFFNTTLAPSPPLVANMTALRTSKRYMGNGTTFPSPIGMACSWNPSLLVKVASVIGLEANALGTNNVFAPVLDLSRELRWGRVEENTGAMGLAFVTGIQGTPRPSAGKFAKARVAAMCKHFAAYGSPTGGLNTAPVVGSERDLRMTYLPPFKTACQDALSLMVAYSAYDGVPALANTKLMVDILRDEWGWPAFAMSDAGGVDLLQTQHKVTSDREGCAKITVDNFVGEMGGGTYTFETLQDQVAAGTVNVSSIDRALSYLLYTKFALGLFEDPFPLKDYADYMRTTESLDIDFQIEKESIVLLQNLNSTLPLSATSGSIALIGPHAGPVADGNIIYGDYVNFNASNLAVTPLAGFQALLQKSNVTLRYAQGCQLWSNDQSGFQEAVEAALISDAAVVFVGTWSRDQTLLWSGANATTGEHIDISSLELVGAQLALVKAVHAVAKKTIVVFVSGKPVTEPWIAENIPAVVQQFYQGERGGDALAALLLGDESPSGRLSVTIPRSVSTHFPNDWLRGTIYGTLDPGTVYPNGTLDFGTQYVLNSPEPQWAFGHGLSYTSFAWSNFSLSETNVTAGATVDVSVTVTNNGSFPAKEVVQVYIQDVISSVVIANHALAGFNKTETIQPGESAKIKIPIAVDNLAIWGASSRWALEAGEFNVRVSTAADNIIFNSSFWV
ncbi:hypothetical protein RQP46_008616 [Phenoliferia psychrophenolica]